MNSLSYIIQVQIAFGFLWVVYRLTMHRSGRFAHNRAYLLAMTAFAFILPALSIPVYPAPAAEPVLMTVYEIDLTNMPTKAVVAETPFDYYFMLRIIYMIGVGALFAFTAMQVHRLWKIVRSASAKFHTDGCHFVDTDNIQSAMAFCNYILINRRRMNPDDLRHIIAHERAHVMLGHSYDMMLAQLLVIGLWWNPFVWLWRRSLKEIHEYQADNRALDYGFDTQSYISLLIQDLTDTYPEFVSGFSYSLIKKRLQMISKNSKGSAARILFSIPAAIVLLAMFSFTQKPVVTIKNVPVKAEAQPKDSVSRKTMKIETVYLREPVSSGGKKETIIITEQNIEGECANDTIKGAFSRDPLKREFTEVRIIGVDGVKRYHATTTANGNDSCVLNVSADVIEVRSKEKDPVMLKKIKIIKTGSGIEDHNTLYVVDGKEVSKDKLDELDLSKFLNITVLKDASAMALYGEKAKDGAILITTTAGNEIDKEVIKIGFGSNSDANMLYILNGKEVDKAKVDELDSNTISEINVLKGETAIAKYGNKGKNGVLIITTKDKKEKIVAAPVKR